MLERATKALKKNHQALFVVFNIINNPNPLFLVFTQTSTPKIDDRSGWIRTTNLLGNDPKCSYHFRAHRSHSTQMPPHNY